jgi:hypothetical protein
MGIKSIIGVSLLALALSSLAYAQQSQYPAQVPNLAAGQYGSVHPGGPYSTADRGYGNPGRPAVPHQFQAAPQAVGSNPGQWPHYPYSQYHNPYYQGMSPRDAISGTIDWVFALPSHLMDRVSGFMDGNFFPQVPATQGAGTNQLDANQNRQVPQLAPIPDQAPPPASPYTPGR